MEKKIVYIPVKNIAPHKDNPRRDYGDITELVDSIKAKGILQSLTVVPITALKDHYTVVIGHRRLEAAKQAGLEEVPCTVEDWDLDTQIKVMMMENMHRADLTTYEEAQGFQMMLDLGNDMNAIAKETGFSKTTIRNRTKLLELDKDEFKAADERGGTIQDYLALDKIKDTTRRNEVLKSVGTNNFNNELQAALRRQENEKKFDVIEEKVSAFAVKMTDKEVEERTQLFDKVISFSYYSYSKPDDVKVPKDHKSEQYYYTRNDYVISVIRFKERGAEEVQKNSQAEAAKKAYLEWYEKKRNELNEVNARHRLLRDKFIQNFTACSKNSKLIAEFAGKVVVLYGGYTVSSNIAKLLEISEENSSLIDKDKWSEICTKNPFFALLVLSYCSCTTEYDSFVKSSYYSTAGNKFSFDENSKLKFIYDFLKSIGYEVSDEEEEMMNGTFYNEFVSDMPEYGKELN